MSIVNIDLNPDTWTLLSASTTQVRISSIKGRFAVAASDLEPTYTPETTWAVNTPYDFHHIVENLGNLYICTSAGTSSKTGSGPTGTGTGITDGSCKWDYTVLSVDFEIIHDGIGGGFTYTSAKRLWGISLTLDAIACVVDRP